MIENLTETTVCPLCNDDGVIFSEESLSLGGNKIVVGIRKCRKCKLIFTSPRLNAAGLERLYNQDYETSSESSQYCSTTHGSAPEYAAISNLVNKYLPQGGEVLDIGCGEGNLLAQLADFGMYRLSGVEISEPAAAQAESRGFRVHRGSVQEVDVEAKSLDAITMMYVLEHVPRPLEILSSAKKLLSDDGVLIVAVPNYNYLKIVYTGPVNILLRRQSTSLMAGEHLFNYTPRTLEALANRAGYRVIEWQSATPHAVGSPLIRLAKRFAWSVSRLLFSVGIHVGGIHAVLRPDSRLVN